MKGQGKPKASPSVKFPALSPTQPPQRAKSLCLRPLPLSPDSSPPIHKAKKRYSFTMAAQSALNQVSTKSLQSNTSRKRLERLPKANFLPPTQCYSERTPVKLKPRFHQMSRTLARIPCGDFIVALLSGEPFFDDVLVQNLRKCWKRGLEVPPVKEEEEDMNVF